MDEHGTELPGTSVAGGLGQWQVGTESPANGARTPTGQFTRNMALTQQRETGFFSLPDMHRVYRECVKAQVSEIA